MKYLTLAALLALGIVPAYAQEQPKTIHLDMTPAELDLVGQALDALPYGKVAPTIQKFRAQVAEQIRPAPTQAARPVPPTKEPEKMSTTKRLPAPAPLPMPNPQPAPAEPAPATK